MSTYTPAAHHCDQRWTCVLTALGDSHSESNLQQFQLRQLSPRLTRFHAIMKFYILIHCIEKNNAKSATPTVPIQQPSWVINTRKPKTWFDWYLISSLNNIWTHSVREGWHLADMHAGWSSAHQIQNAHNFPFSPVYCQQQPIPALWNFVHELWGTVAQVHISWYPTLSV